MTKQTTAWSKNTASDSTVTYNGSDLYNSTAKYNGVTDPTINADGKNRSDWSAIAKQTTNFNLNSSFDSIVAYDSSALYNSSATYDGATGSPLSQKLTTDWSTV